MGLPVWMCQQQPLGHVSLATHDMPPPKQEEGEWGSNKKKTTWGSSSLSFVYNSDSLAGSTRATSESLPFAKVLISCPTSISSIEWYSAEMFHSCILVISVRLSHSFNIMLPCSYDYHKYRNYMS